MNPDIPMETSRIQEEEEASPATKALGPLCKLTEVHLWDDDPVEVRNRFSSKSEEPILTDNFGSSDIISEFLMLPEDLELTRQMNVLGLPVSFQTNKEKRTRSGGKRKGRKKKNLYHYKDISNDILSLVRESEDGDASSAIFNVNESNTLCSISLLGLSERSYSDLEAKTNTSMDEISNHIWHCDLDDGTNLPNDLLKSGIEVEVNQRLDDECSSGSCLIDGNTDEKQSCYQCIEASVTAETEVDGEILLNDVNVELVHESQAAADSEIVELVDSDTAESNLRVAFGDWRAHWDDHYTRTFFYNIVTQESTWDPPPGVDVDLVDDALLNVTFTELNRRSYDDLFHITSVKKEKKTTKEVKQFQGIVGEMSPSINKYWHQRYRLFSRFEEGIQMDEEGWFSVTPERIAKHHASRCAGGVIVDCFTGVGGNAIQFAQRCQHVIAIDIDPRKIDYAQHNAAVYGVEDLIDFVTGDCILVAPKFKADTVFLSPPWGGPDYAKVKVYDINVMLQPYNGHFLFEVARLIAPKVVMFLPRNVDVNQLVELALSASPPCSLEVERNYLNGKLKAITAYFTQQAA